MVQMRRFAFAKGLKNKPQNLLLTSHINLINVHTSTQIRFLYKLKYVLHECPQIYKSVQYN